jgi:membrane-associated phospholipid phosphatase
MTNWPHFLADDRFVGDLGDWRDGNEVCVQPRARPNQGNDPNSWFQGSGYQSFPSGEVTLQASFVTPFIVNYRRQAPWVWALEILPIYDAIARMKSQAHWQTDVIAGWALGTGVGYWSTTRGTPISVQILPGGLSVGFSKRF